MNKLMTAGLAAALLAAAGCTGTLDSSALQESIRTGFEIAGNREQGEQAASATGDLLGTFAPLPPEQERALGEGIALTALETHGARLPDEALQRYVNLVGRSVARAASRAELTYMVAVTDSDGYNAFAGPGGYVFVTRGLVGLMRNEAELAGVIAHEIAHLEKRHLEQSMRREQFFRGLQTALRAGGNDTDYGQAVGFGQDILFTRGYEPRFEFEADALGAQIAAAAGYDPNGLRDLLARLGQQQAQNGGWLQTHPASSRRVAELNRMLGEGLGSLGGAVNEERFQRATASIR
ncbi:MAG: M48 family metalloprotease [Candidatus Sumerlaeia bacterium]|nr:M48 family metalloprotease [Candidatus Sumerlaeia bacterium]